MSQTDADEEGKDRNSYYLFCFLSATSADRFFVSSAAGWHWWLVHQCHPEQTFLVWAGYYLAVSASVARASRWPASTSTRASSAPPTRKKGITVRMALRSSRVSRSDRPYRAGPAMPANFSTTAKNPKNSPERSRGI